MMSLPAWAETLRVATWSGEYSRKGPGLLLRDMLKEPLPHNQTILDAAPDVILLTEFDYDAGGAAMAELRAQLRAKGLDYKYDFAARPNTGMPTGLDVDGDGRLGGPRDAQGYGWFSGQGGQAILSRWPLTAKQDLSAILWRDVPDSAIAPDDPAHDVQRLSTSAHWHVSVETPGGALGLLTIAATPPVFDGPKDRNGRRNRDEVLLWSHVLDGRLGMPPDGPMVWLGLANLDPVSGEGLRGAIQQVLDGPFQDPLPDVPTAHWDQVGALRVSYVLPSNDLTVVDAGIILPELPDEPHRLIWVDLAWPPEPAGLPEQAPRQGASR